MNDIEGELFEMQRLCDAADTWLARLFAAGVAAYAIWGAGVLFG